MSPILPLVGKLTHAQTANLLLFFLLNYFVQKIK